MGGLGCRRLTRERGRGWPGTWATCGVLTWARCLALSSSRRLALSSPRPLVAVSLRRLVVVFRGGQGVGQRGWWGARGRDVRWWCRSLVFVADVAGGLHRGRRWSSRRLGVPFRGVRSRRGRRRGAARLREAGGSTEDGGGGLAASWSCFPRPRSGVAPARSAVVFTLPRLGSLVRVHVGPSCGMGGGGGGVVSPPGRGCGWHGASTWRA